MPSTIRLTAAASPPALGCKCGPEAEGACCATMFAAAKTATVTIKTKQVAIRYNLLQATICLRKRRLVISREHFGKTFHLHEPESGGEWPPVCLRTMIGRVWDISPNRWQKDAYRSATIVELPISAAVIGRGGEEALRSFLPADGLRIKFPRCASNWHK